MKAVHIAKYGRSPTIVETAIPIRKQGQFLLAMKYAPINPSDLNFYLGLYAFRKQGFPIMGFEGSAIIQDCDDPSLQGRKVSVLANSSNGTYAQYLVAESKDLMIWPEDCGLSLQSLASYWINPFSSMGLIQIVTDEAAEAVVLSAATSSLSRMLISYLRKLKGDRLIFGVSRSELLDGELKKLGADRIFRTDQTLELEKALEGRKTVFLDCVGGGWAGKIFNLLPKHSTMVNFGRLSKQNLGGVDLGGLYFDNKRIRGFWLNNWLQQVGDRVQDAKKQVIREAPLFSSRVRQVFELEAFNDALRQSIHNQSLGKVLLHLV